MSGYVLETPPKPSKLPSGVTVRHKISPSKLEQIKAEYAQEEAEKASRRQKELNEIVLERAHRDERSARLLEKLKERTITEDETPEVNAFMTPKKQNKVDIEEGNTFAIVPDGVSTTVKESSFIDGTLTETITSKGPAEVEGAAEVQVEGAAQVGKEADVTVFLGAHGLFPDDTLLRPVNLAGKGLTNCSYLLETVVGSPNVGTFFTDIIPKKYIHVYEYALSKGKGRDYIEQELQKLSMVHKKYILETEHPSIIPADHARINGCTLFKQITMMPGRYFKIDPNLPGIFIIWSKVPGLTSGQIIKLEHDEFWLDELIDHLIKYGVKSLCIIDNGCGGINKELPVCAASQISKMYFTYSEDQIEGQYSSPVKPVEGRYELDLQHLPEDEQTTQMGPIRKKYFFETSQEDISKLEDELTRIQSETPSDPLAIAQAKLDLEKQKYRKADAFAKYSGLEYYYKLAALEESKLSPEQRLEEEMYINIDKHTQFITAFLQKEELAKAALALAKEKGVASEIDTATSNLESVQKELSYFQEQARNVSVDYEKILKRKGVGGKSKTRRKRYTKHKKKYSRHIKKVTRKRHSKR